MGIWGLILLLLIWLFVKAVSKGASANTAKKEGGGWDFSSEMQDEQTVDSAPDPVQRTVKSKDERVQQDELERKTTMQVDTKPGQTQKKPFSLRDAVIYSAILNRPHK